MLVQTLHQLKHEFSKQHASLMIRWLTVISHSSEEQLFHYINNKAEDKLPLTG
jgi:hypothetical protein